MEKYTLEEMKEWFAESMREVDEESIPLQKAELKELLATNAKEFYRDAYQDEWIPIYSTMSKKEVFTKINKVLQIARNNRAPKYDVEVVGLGTLREAIIEDLKSLKDKYEDHHDEDWYINTINNLSIRVQYFNTIEALESDGYEVERF